MANGPLGGFMPTPPAPAQPPQVKLDTTATSRGNFNTFLKNLNGATSLNPPSMAPSVGAAAPTLAPTMSNTDIFDVPQQFLSGGLVQFGQDLQRSLADPVNQKTREIPQFLQVIEDSAKERFGVDLGGSSPMGGFNQFGSQMPNMSMFQPSSPNFQPTQEVGPKDYSMSGMRPSYMPMDQDGDGIDQFGAKMPKFEANQGSPMTLSDAKSAFEQGMSGLKSSAFGSGGSRIAGIGSIGSLFMEEGGSVPPRNTNIQGQPHMLAYITPEEGGILKALGGAGKPGPMGIPSFYEFSDTDSSPAGSFGGDDGSSFSDDAQATDPGFDDSPPDDDMDYTDPDYGYTTVDPDTGQSDMDIATQIGQQVAADQAAQAAANQVQQSLLAQKNQQTINQAIANQQKAKDDLIDAQIDIAKSGTTTTQPSLPSAMTGKGGTTAAANISAASGASLGKDPDRDRSDFSVDLDALANLSKQATKGSFPSLDNIPGTFGVITSMINQATKSGAQNTLQDIERGFAPTYGSDGQITGTTNYGIGMGQPGGLFGGGKSVDGYDVFDDTSPSMGMYDDNQEIGGDESDPLILKRPIDKKDDEDEGPTVLPPLGGITPDDREKLPTVVKSPFDPSTATFTPVGFDSGDLNKLIEQITGIRSPVQLQDGGLIRAVDDFLATGT